MTGSSAGLSSYGVLGATEVAPSSFIGFFREGGTRGPETLNPKP